MLNVLIPPAGVPLEQLWDPERFEPTDDLSKLELEPYAHYLEVKRKRGAEQRRAKRSESQDTLSSTRR